MVTVAKFWPNFIGKTSPLSIENNVAMYEAHLFTFKQSSFLSVIADNLCGQLELTVTSGCAVGGGGDSTGTVHGSGSLHPTGPAVQLIGATPEIQQA